MGEVDLIIALCESVRERQRVVAPSESIALTFEAVLVVADIATDSVPTELFWSISRNL